MHAQTHELPQEFHPRSLDSVSNIPAIRRGSQNPLPRDSSGVAWEPRGTIPTEPNFEDSCWVVPGLKNEPWHEVCQGSFWRLCRSSFFVPVPEPWHNSWTAFLKELKYVGLRCAVCRGSPVILEATPSWVLGSWSDKCSEKVLAWPV